MSVLRYIASAPVVDAETCNGRVGLQRGLDYPALFDPAICMVVHLGSLSKRTEAERPAAIPDSKFQIISCQKPVPGFDLSQRTFGGGPQLPAVSISTECCAPN